MNLLLFLQLRLQADAGRLRPTSSSKAEFSTVHVWVFGAP